MSLGIPFISAEDLRSILTPSDAVDTIITALRHGFDPGADPDRVAVPTRHGQFLMMPSELDTCAGVKIVTIAPDNPGHGRPRIQGIYVLFDSETLTPRALVDATALTNIRTPAVSFAAVRQVLLGRAQPLDVVVFGAGPQARAHLETLSSVLEGRRTIASVTLITRSKVTGDLAERCMVLAAGSPPVDRAIAAAGLIICATSSRTPLFDSAAVREDSVTIAVGSHEPDARELDAALMGRAHVIVEDRRTALRESGDVVLAVREGTLPERSLIPLADVVTGRWSPSAGRPIVFKSSGMSWQDLVIAEALADRLLERQV